jgi:hypothetical protein
MPTSFLRLGKYMAHYYGMPEKKKSTTKEKKAASATEWPDIEGVL